MSDYFKRINGLEPDPYLDFVTGNFNVHPDEKVKPVNRTNLSDEEFEALIQQCVAKANEFSKRT